MSELIEYLKKAEEHSFPNLGVFPGPTVSSF